MHLGFHFWMRLLIEFGAKLCFQECNFDNRQSRGSMTRVKKTLIDTIHPSLTPANREDDHLHVQIYAIPLNRTRSIKMGDLRVLT